VVVFVDVKTSLESELWVLEAVFCIRATAVVVLVVVAVTRAAAVMVLDTVFRNLETAVRVWVAVTLTLDTAVVVLLVVALTSPAEVVVLVVVTGSAISSKTQEFHPEEVPATDTSVEDQEDTPPLVSCPDASSVASKTLALLIIPAGAVSRVVLTDLWPAIAITQEVPEETDMVTAG
jgi:hypothetical protein